MPSSTKPPTAILFDIGGVVVRRSLPHHVQTHKLTRLYYTIGHLPLPSHPRLRARKQDPRRLHQLRDPKRPARHGRMATHRAGRSRAQRRLVRSLQAATLAPRRLVRVPAEDSYSWVRGRWAGARWRQTGQRSCTRDRCEAPLLAHDEDLARPGSAHVSCAQEAEGEREVCARRV